MLCGLGQLASSLGSEPLVALSRIQRSGHQKMSGEKAISIYTSFFSIFVLGRPILETR